MNLHRRLLLLLVAALMVAVTAVVAAGPAFGQVGHGSKASGKAAELAADWWQWALSKPASENPLIGGDPNYSEEQCDGQPVSDTPGKKWFLAGTIDGSEVTRTCTMPVGTQLFFPVVNYIFVITEPEENEQVARQAVNDFIKSVLADPEFSMTVTVDGKEVKNNRIVRADSPLFTLTLPEDNLFGIAAGDYQAVADGLWAPLPPLSEGEHTIQIEMNAPNVGFSQDNTYILTVE